MTVESADGPEIVGEERAGGPVPGSAPSNPLRSAPPLPLGVRDDADYQSWLCWKNRFGVQMADPAAGTEPPPPESELARDEALRRIQVGMMSQGIRQHARRSNNTRPPIARSRVPQRQPSAELAHVDPRRGRSRDAKDHRKRHSRDSLNDERKRHSRNHNEKKGQQTSPQSHRPFFVRASSRRS